MRVIPRYSNCNDPLPRNMESACDKLLTGGDADVFLVALAQHIQTEEGSDIQLTVEDAAKTLLQDKYEPILSRLGWDLLTLFSPHLLPSHHHSWQLVHQISMLCSPKEMVLALLEQMEGLSAGGKPLMVFMMLNPLHTVIHRVNPTAGGVVNSTLRSTFHLLRPLLQSTTVRGCRSEKRERKGSSEKEEDDSDEMELEDSTHNNSMPSDSEDVNSVPILDAVGRTLNFIQSFSDEIHRNYITSSGGCGVWTTRQRECISMLLSLLDYPMVAQNLTSGRKKLTDTRKMAEGIMFSLVQSHCGCMNLLAQRESKEDIDGRNADQSTPLPPVGIGCFAYLLFSEKVELSYLPCVYSRQYLFCTSVRHCRTLLGGQEDRMLWKGLKLFDALLLRLPDHSLPLHVLEDKIYIELSQVLINLMTLSQLKSIRQISVRLFQEMVKKFEEKGRHRFYRNLLHSTNHSGIRGLLIHAVKDEVDTALKVDKNESMFLGQNLVPLLELSLKVDMGIELLKEFDSLMSGLNFLRYLLIRDRMEVNRTGVWDIKDELSDRFLGPLRQLLTETRVCCRNDLLIKREEMSAVNRGDSTEKRSETKVTVQVPSGENLPEPSLQDEIKMLLVAQQHMDMMESVLVRVEELM